MNIEMITVYCLAVETSGMGESSWHVSHKDADDHYARLDANPDYDDAMLTRFNLEFAPDTPPDVVTNEVDAAMWCNSYALIKRREARQRENMLVLA